MWTGTVERAGQALEQAQYGRQERVAQGCKQRDSMDERATRITTQETKFEQDSYNWRTVSKEEPY